MRWQRREAVKPTDQFGLCTVAPAVPDRHGVVRPHRSEVGHEHRHAGTLEQRANLIVLSVVVQALERDEPLGAAIVDSLFDTADPAALAADELLDGDAGGAQAVG